VEIIQLAVVDAKKTEREKAEEADKEIFEAIRSRRKLVSDMELAKGIQYTEPLTTRYCVLSKTLRRIRVVECYSVGGLHGISEIELNWNTRGYATSITFWQMGKTFPLQLNTLRYVFISAILCFSQLIEQDMKIPEPILEHLRSKRIITPTPIQLQGIPAACALMLPNFTIF